VSHSPGAGEVTVHRDGGGMECSVTADEIRYGLFPSDDNGTFSGPVPDGVASVTLSLAAAAGRHAGSVTGTVHGNFYAIDAGGSEPLRPGSPTVTRRAADGRVLRRYTEPGPRSAAQVCREHPEACVPAVALDGGAQQVSASSSSASATVQSAPSPRGKGSGG
jgi:hypothetical protein